MRTKALALAVLVAALAVLPAFAAGDPACDPYAFCPFIDGFTGGAGNWSALGNTQTAWLADKTFGSILRSSADGLLTIAVDPHTIEQTIRLDPGSYVINARYATDIGWLMVWRSHYFTVSVITPDAPTQTQTLSVFDSATTDRTRENYASFQSAPFTTTVGGDVKVILAWDGVGSNSVFLDHVLIGDYGSVIVGGPFTPSPPTGTPWPTAQPQATPVAGSSAFYCIPAGTSEMNIPPANYWATLTDGQIDTINNQRPAVSPSALGWDVNPTTTTTLNASYLGAAGSSIVPFLPDPNDGTFTRAGIMWHHVVTGTQYGELPPPFYVDIAAEAASLNTGETAYIDILKQVGGTWYVAQSMAIASGVWRTGHYTITAASAVQAVGFAARGPAGKSAYIGRVLVYGHPALAMRCDGTFSSITVAPYGIPGNTSPVSSGQTIVFPVTKECPPPIKEPNNFWGPLLSGLTIWLDTFTAFWPAHTQSGFIDSVTTLSQSPVWSFVSIVTGFVDLTPVFIAAGVMLGMEGVRALWSLWLIIKKTIPFLG